jgi:hypothetical protein
MISSYNIHTMDMLTLLYFFEKRSKRILLNHNETKDLTDEQLDLIENKILPAVEKVLQQEIAHVS